MKHELLVPHPASLMPNLTKRDLVVKISNETGLVQHQVFEVIQKTLDQITTALSKGQDVELRNFGVFQVRLSKARVGRNPNIPGSNFAIPPRATVKFKSGKIMRRDVLALSDNMKKGSGKAPARSAVRNVATASKRANGQN
jgi:nucleoid DNA-binding protein